MGMVSKNMKRILSIATVSILFLSACAPDTSPEAVTTAAAMTVEAALTNSQPALATPTAAEAQATTTQESSEKPFASFEDVTNCRTGPGVNYERITQITPGFSVEIIGFFPPNYWIVQTDAGPCWVAGEFVTPAGNISAVPTVTAPPTPKAEAPEGVSVQKWDISCNFETNEAQITLIWADQEDEAGYRIVRNDTVVAELSANTTQYKETITLLSGQTVGYIIIAFNGAGQSQSKSISMGC